MTKIILIILINIYLVAEASSIKTANFLICEIKGYHADGSRHIFSEIERVRFVYFIQEQGLLLNKLKPTKDSMAMSEYFFIYSHSNNKGAMIYNQYVNKEKQDVMMALERDNDSENSYKIYLRTWDDKGTTVLDGSCFLSL